MASFIVIHRPLSMEVSFTWNRCQRTDGCRTDRWTTDGRRAGRTTRKHNAFTDYCWRWMHNKWDI